MPEYLTVPQAAKEKGCTAQALRNAIQRGDLNAIQPGPRSTLILCDDLYEAFAVQATGGRMHARYRAKTSSTGTSV